jgi:hypothetical protein
MKRAVKFSLFALAAIAAGPAAADESVLKMSPFEVSANSVDFKSWIKLGSPHYIVYTDASEKEAATALRELEELHVVAQVFFRRTALNFTPTVIVLPTSHSDWKKIESKGGVEWTVAVSQQDLHLQDIVLVQYDWQERGLGVVRAAQGRDVMQSLSLGGPFWFERGIGKFFETLEITDNKVTLGRQNQRTLRLSRDAWLKWPQFFSLTDESPEFRREGTVGLVEGQAALFVHYLLTHAEPGWRDRLIDWVERMNAGRAPTEAEFKSVFGQEWKTWQRTMENYLDRGTYRVQNFPIGKKSFEFATTKYDLPVREMRELFVIAQILNQHVPASEAALDSLLARGIQFESLRQFLAEACFEHGRVAAGVEQLRVLAAGHTPDPRVYAMLAGRVLLEKIPQVSIRSRLDGEAEGKIRALTRQALELEPHFVPAIDLLVWTEALGPAIGAENLAAIERHYRTLDGYASTSDAVAAMGVAAWRAGSRAWAGKIAEALEDSPYADRDARRIADELLGELGRKPAEAPPAAIPETKP